MLSIREGLTILHKLVILSFLVVAVLHIQVLYTLATELLLQQSRVIQMVREPKLKAMVYTRKYIKCPTLGYMVIARRHTMGKPYRLVEILATHPMSLTKRAQHQPDLHELLTR